MTKDFAASNTTSTTNGDASDRRDHVRQSWLTADCVCFDVDSTVCTEEAIDELAKFQKVGALVEDITRNAMGGNMSFRTALKSRLNLIKPTYQRLEQFLINHPSRLTDGVSELIDLLHERKVPVFLITGGFHSIVDPVAKELNIPLTNVFANRLLFNIDGTYASFDENELTSDSGGKRLVIDHLRNKYHFKNLIMIGDGVTDMEADADGFIGFGGNIVREKVRDGAPWFINSFYTLIDELRNNMTTTDSYHQTATTGKCSTEIKEN